MNVISGRPAIKEEYSRSDVAETYVEGRFEHDELGRGLHERQVRILHDVFARVEPRRILEIAPGPARVSVRLPSVPFACAVEQSPAMLDVGRERLRRHGARSWRLIRGDGFQLPLGDGQFDLALTFRFARHFPKPERRMLLDEIRRVLRPGGTLVMDVANRPMYAWWFSAIGIDRARVDDYWFLENEFVQEMQDAGFRVERLFAVQPALPLLYFIHAHVGPRFRLAARLASRVLGRLTRRQPLEWVAFCRCA